jgi:protein-tyrosine phosphatase
VGALYRSDSLSTLRGEDRERFQALGVRTVIDLRHEWEIAAAGRVPESDELRYHNFSIERQPYYQAGLDPRVDAVSFLAERFAEVAADGVTELRQTLEVIASEGSAPVVFHCAGGKDRSGIVAALVLALLGVSQDDIAADFALTEATRDWLIADWRRTHPGEASLWPGYGRATAELMRLFLSDLAAKHGSVRDYTANLLGVTDDAVIALHVQYLGGEPG